MVLACERIFSRTSMDARPQNLHTFSEVKLKYIQRTRPMGQARYSFHLPFSYNLQIGNGASTNFEPCCLISYLNQLPSETEGTASIAETFHAMQTEFWLCCTTAQLGTGFPCCWRHVGNLRSHGHSCWLS